MDKNSTIKEAAHFEDEQFEGRTTLSESHPFGELSFTGCTFTGEGLFDGSYALHVNGDARPRARFKDCTFRHADKLALAQWCLFEDCLFEDAEDGIFDKGEFRLHVEGCRFQSLGTSSPLVHPDCIQTGGGPNCRYGLIKNNWFDVPYANSWVFLETKWGPVESIRVIGNEGIGTQGPTYDVWLWDDGRGFGGPKKCWVDKNRWDRHQARLPVAYNFAGGELMIGHGNRPAA